MSSFFFFFKQKTAYEISACLVGSEMCIRDRRTTSRGAARATLDRPAPPRARESLRSEEPHSESHCLLRRPRHPRADSYCYAGRRTVLGRSVRPCRIEGWLQGGVASGGRRSDGHPIQRRPVGE